MRTANIIASTATLIACTIAGSALADTGQNEPLNDSEPSAEPGVFQISLWDSVQIIDEARPIYGVRLNLPYGSNQAMHGFDFGIASHTAAELRGVQLGIGGYVGGRVEGVQYNYVLSIAKAEVLGWQHAVYGQAASLQGVQTGAVNHTLGSVQGLQLGIVNLAMGEAEGAEISAVNVMGQSHGFQLALVNVANNQSRGLELGLVNYSGRARGLQLGVVNVTDELRGVQVGVANVAKSGGLPFMPIVNAAL